MDIAMIISIYNLLILQKSLLLSKEIKLHTLFFTSKPKQHGKQTEREEKNEHFNNISRSCHVTKYSTNVTIRQLAKAVTFIGMKGPVVTCTQIC